MKRNAFLLIFLAFTLIPVMAQETAPEKLFYHAVYAEQVDGNLTKARALYEQILQSKPDDRILMAKTLYRLGLIGEKEGAQKALGYYTRVIEQFPEQKDIIELVQTRVDKLDNANTFIDPRDGHKYKWVKIGNQIWMAENLAYMPWVNPPKKQEYGIWVYDYDGEDVVEAKASENYQKYGCLYDWATAMAIEPKYLEEPWNGNSENYQGICPPGWHLPTDGDWKLMEKSLGMTDSLANETWQRAGLTGGGLKGFVNFEPVGRYLKSSWGWNSDGNGDDSCGFGAMPGGERNIYQPGGFINLGYTALFWTATEGDTLDELDSGHKNVAWYRELEGQKNKFSSGDDINRYVEPKSDGYSVRCLKDNGDTTRKNLIGMINLLESPGPVIKTEPPKLQTPKILWSIKKNQWISPVVVSQGVIVFACRDSFIYGYDYQSQKELWKLKYSPIQADYPIPVSNQNQVFVSVGEKVTSINSKTGEILWIYSAPKGLTNLCLDQDFVYGVQYAPSMRGKVPVSSAFFCLEQKTGNLVWENHVQDPVSTLPRTDGKILVFNTLANATDINLKSYCVAIDCKTGKEKWRFETNRGGGSDPWLENGLTYFGTYESYVFAVDNNTGKKYARFFIGGDLVFGDPLVQNEILYIGSMDKCFYAFDVKTGKEKWRFEGAGGFRGSSVLMNNQIVSVALGSILYGMDCQTGDPIWKIYWAKGFKNNHLAYDDKIIISTGDGNVMILDPPQK